MEKIREEGKEFCTCQRIESLPLETNRLKHDRRVVSTLVLDYNWFNFNIIKYGNCLIFVLNSMNI